MEFRICKELEKSEDQVLKGFWCDGVSWLPGDNQLNKKHVNDSRKIITKAWVGKTGQDEYQATINFGRKALSKYSKGITLMNSIPDIESEIDWIEIDTDNKTIVLELR